MQTNDKNIEWGWRWLHDLVLVVLCCCTIERGEGRAPSDGLHMAQARVTLAVVLYRLSRVGSGYAVEISRSSVFCSQVLLLLLLGGLAAWLLDLVALSDESRHLSVCLVVGPYS